MAENIELKELPENPAPAENSQAKETTPGELISSEINSTVSIPPPSLEPAQVASPSQILSGDLPGAPSLPPPPILPKRGPGRPRGVKNRPREALGESSVVIPGSVPENLTGDDEDIGGDETAPPQPEKPPVNHRQLAEMAFDLTTNSMAAFVGNEWRANDDTERNSMVIVLEAYFKTKQMDDIPPGAILCFAIATYLAPRLRVPNTADKLRRFWGWLLEKLGARKIKRAQASSNSNPFATGGHGN